MVDKNLFLYDLAVTAIFKNEARYLKEWLDYHLLAGVEHFYLYNNESSDDYKKILAPYVEENLVTLIDWPGEIMQLPAYNDAIDKFRFECRYMAFIDLDEFIFPKSNRSIVEVVDEILSDKEDAAGLGINWQIFGSNGQINADYSCGVLERFTRRASTDRFLEGGGNAHIKTIANPREVNFFGNPHFAYYFIGRYIVNENGGIVQGPFNAPVTAEKIVINHYHTKSREEYRLKHARGRADTHIEKDYGEEKFNAYDRNEVFDDGALKYRAARAENFSFESDAQRINRVVNNLFKTLTEISTGESLNDKLETFLTCRTLAEKFQIKIGDRSAEEFALAWIYRTLTKDDTLTYDEIQTFLRALPEILARPFPICKKIQALTQKSVIPNLCAALKDSDVFKDVYDWRAYFNWLYVQKFLRLIN